MDAVHPYSIRRHMAIFRATVMGWDPVLLFSLSALVIETHGDAAMALQLFTKQQSPQSVAILAQAISVPDWPGLHSPSLPAARAV